MEFVSAMRKKIRPKKRPKQPLYQNSQGRRGKVYLRPLRQKSELEKKPQGPHANTPRHQTLEMPLLRENFRTANHP